MEVKHTPGPWRIEERFWNLVIIGPDGVGVCSIPSLSRNRKENEANLALIAQAPAMLKVLEHIMYVISHSHVDGIVHDTILYNKIIARAKGE